MKEKTMILCLGDSITYGLKASDTKKSYPSVLGNLLGEKYTVKNFGRNGATAINRQDYAENKPSPYKKSPEYREAIVAEADIAILMLGMNDANPTHSWNLPSGIISEDMTEAYERGMEELICDFERQPSAPWVILAEITPMTRKKSEIFSEIYVRSFTENLIKLRKIQRKIAGERNICLIETEALLDKAEYFDDGCHLTDAGYHRLAEIIAKRIISEIRM